MPNLRFGGRLERLLREESWPDILCGAATFPGLDGEEDVVVCGDDSDEGTEEETRSSCSVAAILGTCVRFSRRWSDRGPLLKLHR